MKKTVILSSLALLALIAVLAWSVFKPSQETIKIAIAAPLSNIGQTTAIGAESMVRGARLYVDQINQAGGIEGKKLELEIYDDHNEANIAAEVAHKIVASDALAVIGHYSSKTSLVAGKIYQAYGIPAVTGSATTDDVTKWNNWYFRTIFANSNQGLFIADYINKILKRSRMTIIYSPDSYGLTLAEDVAASFIELGGKVVNRWSLETDADRDRIVDDLVAIEENGQDPGLIFMAAGLEKSANLIAKIKLYGLNYSIFGLESGKIVEFGEDYMRQTDIVYTEIDVNQVTNIDEKTSTYLMDFYLWFRYQGKDLDPAEIEFSNYGIERLDSGDKLAIEEPLEEKRQDGVDYKLFRIKADFKEEFNFRDYPFDTQTLAVRFRHSHLTQRQINLRCRLYWHERNHCSRYFI